MKTIERIKEIEFQCNHASKIKGSTLVPEEKLIFLIKAFRAMQSTAMHIRKDYDLSIQFTPAIDKCKVDVLKEFEKRMEES